MLPIVVIGVVGVLEQRQDPKIEAVREQTADLGTDLSASLTSGEQRCLDREAAGLDPDTLLTDSSQDGIDQRARLMNLMILCVPDVDDKDDFVTAFAANFDASTGFRIEIEDTQARCLIRHALDTADPGRWLTAGPDPDELGLYRDHLETCLDAESLGVLRGDIGSGPQSYGDDARLDGLYDDCRGGDERACDILYLDTAFESAYNDLGLDCAGRGDGTAMCTPGLELDPVSGEAVEGSSGAVALGRQCADGEMTACDLIYRVAPLGSELENFGFTCGGRIAVGALPDCRTRFPD